MPTPAPTPFTYRESKSIFDDVQRQGLFKDYSLADFSSLVNQATQSNAFEAADSSIGNAVKDFAIWKENEVKNNFPVVTQKAGEWTQGLFEKMGLDPEAGKQLGESIPVMAADFAPATAGPVVGAGIGGTIGLFGGPVTAAGGLVVGSTVGKVVSSLLSAATAYEQTDSLLHSAIALFGFPLAHGAQKAVQPVIGAALRKVGGKGGEEVATILTEKLAATPAGQALVAQGFKIGEELTQKVAKSVLDRVGYYAGGQAAVLGAFETASFAADAYNEGFGQAMDEHLTGENMMSQLVSTLPFMALDLPHLVKPTPLTAMARKHAQTVDQLEVGSLITKPEKKPKKAKKTKKTIGQEAEQPTDPAIESALETAELKPPTSPEEPQPSIKADEAAAPEEEQLVQTELPLDLPPTEDSTQLPPPAESSQVALPKAGEEPVVLGKEEGEAKVEEVFEKAKEVDGKEKLQALAEESAGVLEQTGKQVEVLESGVVEDVEGLVTALGVEKIAEKKVPGLGRMNSLDVAAKVGEFVKEGRSIEEAVEEVGRLIGAHSKGSLERNQRAFEKFKAEREAVNGGFKSVAHRERVEKLVEEAKPVVEWAKELVGQREDAKSVVSHGPIRQLLQDAGSWLSGQELAGPEYQPSMWKTVGDWKSELEAGTLKGKNKKVVLTREEATKVLEQRLEETARRLDRGTRDEKTHMGWEKLGLKKAEARERAKALNDALPDDASFYYSAEVYGKGEEGSGGVFGVRQRARVIKNKLSEGEYEAIREVGLADELRYEGVQEVEKSPDFTLTEKVGAKKAFDEAVAEANLATYDRLWTETREVLDGAEGKLRISGEEFDQLLRYENGEWVGDLVWLDKKPDRELVMPKHIYPGLSQVFGSLKPTGKMIKALLEARRKVVEGTLEAGDFKAKNSKGKLDPGVVKDLVDAIVPMPNFRSLVEKAAAENGLHPDMGKRLGEKAEMLEKLWGGEEHTVYGLMQGDGDVLGLATTKGNTKALLLAADGLGKELGDPLKLLIVAGHEAGHNYEWSMERGHGTKRELEAFGRFREFAELGSAEDKKFALELFADAYVPEAMREHKAVAELLEDARNVDPAEWRANMLSLWSMSKLGLENARDAQLLQVAPVRGFFKHLTAFAGRMYRAIKAAMGLTRGVREAKKLKEYVDQIEGYRKAARDADETLAEAGKLMRAGRFDVDEIRSFAEAEADSFKAYVGKSVTLDRWYDKWLGRFDSALNTMDQFVAGMPVFGRLAKVIHSKSAQAAAISKELTSVLAGTQLSNGAPEYDTMGKKIDKLHENRAASRVLNAWALAQQRSGSQLIKFDELATKQPKIYDAWLKLDKDSQEVVKEAHTRVTNMVAKAHEKIFAEWDEDLVAKFRNIFASKSKGNWDTANAAAAEITNAIRTKDVTRLMAAMDQVEGWAGDPKQQSRTIEQIMKMSESIEKNKAAFRKKAGYWSLSKTGKWFLHWSDKAGNTDGLGFDSEKDAKAFIKTHLKGAQNVDLRYAGASKEYRLDADMFTILENSYKEFAEVVDVLVPDKDTANQLKLHGNPMTQIREHLNSKLPGLIKTGRKPDAFSTDHMDMLRTQFHFINETGNAIAKAKFNRDLVYEKLNPALDPYPEKMRDFEQRIDNFVTPDTDIGRKVNTLNSIMFVASNPSSWLVELTQGISTFLPELANHGVGFFKGHQMLARAHKKAFDFTIKAIKAGVNNNKLWGDPETTKLFDEAAKNNLISVASTIEGAQMDSALKAGVDVGSLRTKGRIETAQEYLKNTVAHLGMSSLRAYRKVTEHNAVVSLLIGKELAESKGLTGQAMRDFAQDYSRLVTYSGGKANRPNLPFSGRGATKTAGEVAMSLQTYTVNNIAQWIRYLRTSFSGTLEGKGMTAEQRKNARKALAQMTFTQLGFAGMLGMPFVQSALILIGKATGLNLEEDVREAIFDFGKVLSDDDEFAGALQEIVSSGAANYTLEKAGVPIDFGSRQSVGGMFGFNSMDGFSGDKLLGPTASLFANAMAGTRAVVDGEGALAVQEFAPTGFKKAINLLRNDFEITDKSGKRIVDDSTVSDKILYALGFQNTKLSKSFQLEKLRRENGLLESKDTAMDVKKLVELYHANPSAMMQEFMVTLKDHPERDPHAMARAVADRLVETTFPNDQRRAGTKATAESDSKLLRMFGMAGAEPSEMNRLLVKTKVLGSLGMDSRLTQSEVRAAQALDNLMRANPNLTRQGAKTILEQQKTPRTRAVNFPKPPQLLFN